MIVCPDTECSNLECVSQETVYSCSETTDAVFLSFTLFTIFTKDTLLQ